MLSRKVFLAILNRGVAAGFGLVSMFFVARYIPKENFGMIHFALGLVGLVSFMGNFGFSFAHIKRMNEEGDKGECMGTFMSAKILFTGILVVATVGLFFVWENILGYSYTDPDTPKVVYIILGYYVFWNLNNIFYHTFTAQLKTALQETSIIVTNIVQFVGIVIVALFIPRNLFWFAGVYVMSTASGLCFSIYFFLRERIPVGRPTTAMFKRYAVYALPLMFSSMIGVVAIYTDKVMLQLFWYATEVADYAMAQRITLVIIGLSSAMGTIIFPAIASAAEKGEGGEVQVITYRAERYISMIVMPMVMFLVVFPRDVLHILGDQYLPAADVLRIMSLYAFFAVIYGVYVSQLKGLGRPGFIAKVSILIALLNIGLNLLFIPSAIYGRQLMGMGAMGAAIALLTSKVVGYSLIQSYSRSITQARFNHSLPLQIVAVAVAALVLLGANAVLPPTRIFIIVPYFFIGVAVYAAVLYLLKEFTRKDLDFFLSALHPGDMKDYIKDEMKGNNN